HGEKYHNAELVQCDFTTRTVGRGGEYYRSRTMSKRLPGRVILFVMLFGVCAAHSQPVPESAKRLRHGSHVALPPEKAHAVVIPRFEKPPVIDGKLDDEAWKQAAVLKDFYQVQPGDNIKPTAPTEVLLGYDAQALYIGIRAYDDPSQVRA